MSLEEPKTYGEIYYKTRLEMETEWAEIQEDSLKEYIPSIFTDPEIRESIPFDVLPKLESLLAFEHPGLAGVGGNYIDQIAGQAVSMVMTPAMRKTQYAANRFFANLIMQPDTAMELWKRRVLPQDAYTYRFRAAGYNAEEQAWIENASYPYPGIPDLIRWARYTGDPSNPYSTLNQTYQIDPLVYSLWEWQSRQQYTTDQILTLMRRDYMTQGDAFNELRKLGWSNYNLDSLIELGYDIPNAMLLLQGDLMQEADNSKIRNDLRRAGVREQDADLYIDAVLAKPAANDLIQYHLRQENRLADLDDDLRKIGIHSKYIDYYHELAHPIPPVADIISMAVREAFSPGTASRFGQYEDFPSEFERYAEMKGLSSEWAERYWAAHWSLPSANQGFEMLHRGIIDESDLTLLLKALDIMPFWRDRLVELAYRPLTRVDVKRMYSLGVLNESDVVESYEKLGYAPENARRMTEYTIQQTLQSMAKFTTRDVVKAYTDRKIDRGEASSLLTTLGVAGSDIGYILQTADYKKEWAAVDSRIGGIRNLYKKQQYNENQARGELLGLALPADEVNNLMDAWYYEKKEEGVQTLTKAETLKFLKNKLIDEEFARNELQLIGYDPERIDIYIKSLTWSQEEES